MLYYSIIVKTKKIYLSSDLHFHVLRAIDLREVHCRVFCHKLAALLDRLFRKIVNVTNTKVA